jgi:hypothetical protein
MVSLGLIPIANSEISHSSAHPEHSEERGSIPVTASPTQTDITSGPTSLTMPETSNPTGKMSFDSDTAVSSYANDNK